MDQDPTDNDPPIEQNDNNNNNEPNPDIIIQLNGRPYNEDGNSEDNDSDDDYDDDSDSYSEESDDNNDRNVDADRYILYHRNVMDPYGFDDIPREIVGAARRMVFDNADEDQEVENPETYNIEQTDSHSYLGQLNENNSSSLKYFVPTTIKTEVPVFYCQFFVPAPGQEFPLIFRANIENEFPSLIQNIFVIGHDDGFGVSVQIEKYSVEHGRSSVTVTARQRVKILSKSRRMFGNFFVTYYSATVMFLPEFNQDPLSLLRFQTNAKDDLTLSSLISIPFSAFTNLDHNFLMSAIQEKLKTMFVNFETIQFPTQASQFSFFVLNFFPLTKNEKSFLIKLSSTIERLLFLKAIVSTPFNISCFRCNSELNDSNDFIQMKPNSSSCVFVNPHGYVFELFPVRVKPTIGYEIVHRDFSWFIDYSWAFSSCVVCSAHVGWLFQANRPSMRPRRFTTVNTKSVVLTFVQTDDFYIKTINKISHLPQHDNVSVDGN